MISVAVSMDKSLMRGIVSEKKLSGTLLGKRIEDGVLYIKVDTAEYEVVIAKKIRDDIAAKIKELEAAGKTNPTVNATDVLPAIGTSVTAYFGYMGKISVITAGRSLSGYGFIIKKYYDDAEEKYSLRMMTNDGEKDVYDLGKTVKIDGESYKYSGGSLNAYMQSFEDYQMVIYKLNSNDEITFLDTAKTDKGGSGDVLKELTNGEQSIKYYDSQNSFNGNAAMADEVVSFSTPLNDDAVKYDFDLYATDSKPTGFGSDYKLRMYTSSEDSFLVDCIQLIKGGSGDDYTIRSPYMLVTEVEQTLDADGNETRLFRGFKNADKVEYSLSPDYIYKDDGMSMDAAKVVAGDIIKYTLNARNEIAYVVPIKRMGCVGAIGLYAEDTTDTRYKGWFSHTSFCLVSGFIQSREDKYIGLVPTAEELSQSFVNPKYALRIENGTSIYYVSKGRKTIVEKTSDIGVLTDYQHNGIKTEVYCVLQNAGLKMVVVYGA